MVDLITPPSGQTTLTATNTFNNATISAGSTLSLQGTGTRITVQGSTTNNAYVVVGGGASLQLLGPYGSTGPDNSSIELTGSGASLEVGSGAYFIKLVSSYPYIYAQNATILVDDPLAALTLLGWSSGDSLRFYKPATAVSYAVATGGGTAYTRYQSGTLTVTFSDRSTTDVVFDAYNGFKFGSIGGPAQGNFAISGGAVVYQSIVPPPPPVAPGVAGINPNQSVLQTGTIRPFNGVTVTDINAGAVDTVRVKLSRSTGTLIDPAAAANGSSFDAATGTYTVVGTAAVVTAALRDLVFSPNVYTLGSGDAVTTALTVSVASSAGIAASDVAVTVNSRNPATRFDYTADGRSDLLLENADGSKAILVTNGLGATQTVSLGNSGAAWHIVGSADFNGDGQSDILLQNDDGSLVTYLMNGTNIAGGYSLGNPGAAWHVRGVGDFNRDNSADILIQNDNGALVLYETNGTNIIAGISLGALPTGWAVQGVADFNGDGQLDILAQNADSTLVVYTMDGTAIASGGLVGTPGRGYAVSGTGDYTGDGKADILLHNANGANVVLAMDGPLATAAIALGNPGSIYRSAVAGIDINKDGRSDLVIQDAAAGTLVAYTLDDHAAITAGAVLGTPGSTWSVAQANPTTFIDAAASGTSLAATGGRDEFNLSAAAAGTRTITGFDPAQDTLALSRTTFPNYVSVQARQAATPGGTLVALSPTATVLLAGVTPDQLGPTSFTFR